MKSLTLFFACLLVHFSYAQRVDRFSHYDSEWKPTDLKNAAYFVRVRQAGDNSFVKNHLQQPWPQDQPGKVHGCCL
ncbi:MAG: hypothetical protein INR73_16155 [Williamsia sp.]|nr:hypothetical protein [Williamsia sp.]